MPRPGPRPYECVRRSWHSDRHQPMRGSVIQEIFRVANEVHGPATRKNKEWQEKLPLVVLKAEEIMYSKASSEAEYMDLKTLWERANDAVDTIIRRDNGAADSGDFLQPCIEAALNLGCIPRRASRSQRHSYPRCYLSSGSVQEEATDDASTPSLKIPDIINRSQSSNSFQPPQAAHPRDVHSNNSSSMVPWYTCLPSFPAAYCGHPEVVGSVTSFPPHQQRDLPIPPTSCCEFPTFSPEDSPPSGQAKSLSFRVEYCTWPSLARVYPLYYGTDHQSTKSDCSVRDPISYSRHTVTSGSPHVPIVREVKARFLHNFLGTRNSVDTTEETSNLEGTTYNPLDSECNLSLHLGLPSLPCLDAPDVWAHEVEDVGSSSSRDSNKFYDVSPTQLGAKCSVSSKGKGLVFLS